MLSLEYQKFVETNWVGAADAMDNLSITDLFVMTTGLGGEVGEVLEKLKKLVRDGTYDGEGLARELGDVLFYLTTIARKFGYSLEDIMAINVAKLNDRSARGVMRGEGDNR